jgi:hypothetical protein
MKLKLFLLVGLMTVASRADILPPRAATQAEVDAGTATKPYVSPATLAGRSGGGAGSGNVSTNSNGSVPLIMLTNYIDAVTQFGFVGDGVTDNRTAFSNMFNFAYQTILPYSVHFVFRRGVYNCVSNSLDTVHNNNSLVTIPVGMQYGSQIIVEGADPNAYWGRVDNWRNAGNERSRFQNNDDEQLQFLRTRRLDEHCLPSLLFWSVNVPKYQNHHAGSIGGFSSADSNGGQR